MSLCQQSVQGRLASPVPVTDYLAGEQLLERFGDFVWQADKTGRVTDLILWLPGNEGGSIAPIPVAMRDSPKTGRAWEWDGNVISPTLAPSLWRNQPSRLEDGTVKQHRNEWHGHLQAGFLRSC